MRLVRSAKGALTRWTVELLPRGALAQVELKL